MTEKSNTSYKKQPIEITNPEIWNKVWIQVVACYWEDYWKDYDKMGYFADNFRTEKAGGGIVSLLKK